MRVTFLGTGSAMPVADRVQTGLLLEAAPGDGRPLLVDCGAGVLHRLSQTDPGYEAVSTVLLTHHHLDHVSDLLPLLKARWLAGEEQLEVVGPPGTKGLLDGLLGVHDYLDGRVDLQVREVNPDESFEVSGFEVRARETRHSIQCLAYRFSDPGSEDAFVFSGDTEAFEGLATFADGARVLAHDCSFPDEVDVDNHPTPSQLGEALAGYDVGRVYLTHQYPHTEGRHEEMIESVRNRFDGDVRVARDGLRFEV
ncbi:MBL fold metallo-hydrolase [Halorarum salinum]|uniref:MBL fold metallo-hydrolase n=1 Tax=Halorarum salinum TaxID=2743089 RepID=A0A7D5QGV0_9EURY|nr:MBL fold metallo-hydrolase [Halobaculum salinum]QLG62503.1 MBL fold metallo-hydrolase [Halobaculum salinum]